MTEPLAGTDGGRLSLVRHVPKGAVVNSVHAQLARERQRDLRQEAVVANRRHAVLAARRLDRRARLADQRARAARAALVALPLHT
ncbi:MAG TPA: hypothetical protein VF288_12885 [Mycobacteriales bacterium]